MQMHLRPQLRIQIRSLPLQKLQTQQHRMQQIHRQQHNLQNQIQRQDGHTQLHIALAQAREHQIPVGTGRYQQHQQADTNIQRTGEENLAQ